MSTGMQTSQDILSTFTPFGPPVLSTHSFAETGVACIGTASHPRIC